MFRSKTISILTIFALITITGCRQNLYMTDGTEEFNTVTQKFVGNWAIDNYSRSGDEVIGDIFTKGTLYLNFSPREAVFTFWVSDSYVDNNLADWKEKWPDIEVDEYMVISSGTWSISNSGEILYFNDMANSIDIKGSGENFEGFYGAEQMKFVASESVGSDAGLAGMMARAATKSATGTDVLFPRVLEQYNFDISENVINVTGRRENSFNISK